MGFIGFIGFIRFIGFIGFIGYIGFIGFIGFCQEGLGNRKASIQVGTHSYKRRRKNAHTACALALWPKTL